MNGQLTSTDDIMRALTAGRATLTVVSKGTGSRFTFKFTRPKGEDPDRAVWVKVLTGADNTRDFRYLGVIWPKDMVYRPKSGEPSSRAIAWVVQTLRERPSALLDAAEVWHNGTCARCGRKLTVPESIKTGLGPECRGRV